MCLASVASGVMPFSSSPRPGSVRCLPGSSRACRPWRTAADRSGSGRSSPSPISLLSSLIWRATICCCLFFQAIVGVDEEQRRCRNLKPADRVQAYQQRIPWWSYGALGWLAVFTGALLLLVEGRPTLFLPACVSYGRQFQLQLGGHAEQVMLLWRFRRTKWFVPGGGEIQSGRRLSRTRSRFLLSVWGPPCKSQGLTCYFLFLLGPVVIYALMLIQ